MSRILADRGFHPRLARRPRFYHPQQSARLDGYATRPAAVLFDIGMTLIHPSGDVMQEELARAGHRSPPEPQDCAAALVLAAEARHLHLPLGADGDEKVGLAWGHALRVRADIALPAWRACLARRDLYCELDPDAVSMLEQLRETDALIAAVSNSDGTLEDELHWFGLDNYFHVVVDSTAVNSEKPHPAIFMATLQQLDVDAGSCWFVGDGLINDVLAARAVGIGLPILYDRFAAYSYLPGVTAVTRLLEISDAVTRAAR